MSNIKRDTRDYISFHPIYGHAVVDVNNPIGVMLYYDFAKSENTIFKKDEGEKEENINE